MTPEKYGSSEQTSRVCRALVMLAGNTVNGMLPGELAKALNTSPATITRMLAHLKQEGFVEETKLGGRWRLGSRVAQIGLAALADVAARESELNEIKQRYSRTI